MLSSRKRKVENISSLGNGTIRVKKALLTSTLLERIRVVKETEAKLSGGKKSKASSKSKNKKAKEEPELYCICRTPEVENDDRFYIGCESCAKWFHGDCVGIKEEDVTDSTKYYCPACIEETKSEADEPVEKEEEEEVDTSTTNTTSNTKSQAPGNTNEDYFEGVECKCSSRDPQATYCVECDGCNTWYHGPCYRIPENLPGQWMCPKCQAKANNNNINNNTNNSNVSEPSLAPPPQRYTKVQPYPYSDKYGLQVPSGIRAPRVTWSAEQLILWMHNDLGISQYTQSIFKNLGISGAEFYYLKEPDLTTTMKIPLLDSSKLLDVLAKALKYAQNARELLNKHPSFKPQGYN